MRPSLPLSSPARLAVCVLLALAAAGCDEGGDKAGAEGAPADGGAAGDAQQPGDAGGANTGGGPGDARDPPPDASGADSAAADGGTGTGQDAAGADGGAGSADGGGQDAALPSPLPEQSAPWPEAPVVLGDGAVWVPRRIIPDGKGGKLVLNDLPPLLKPKKTRYSPARDQPGLLSIIFREGSGVVVVDGRFASTAGADMKAVQAVQAKYGPWLGAIGRTFPGDKAKLDAQRLKLEQKTGRALRDRTLFFKQQVHSGANVGEVADAFNAAAVVELASPVPRPPASGAVAKVGTSTAHDVGVHTPDYTLLQTHLLSSSTAPPSDGGHGVTYAWSLPGGRGEGTHAGQTEYHWNRQHEDIDNASTVLESTWGGLSSQQAGVNHDMGCMGIYKARNDAMGVTGICSETTFHMVPTSNVDEMSNWAGTVATFISGGSWDWRFARVLEHLASTLPAGSAVSASLQTAGPNAGRPCTLNDGAGTPSPDCTPRVQCLPAPPYANDGPGVTRMRCEGFPYLNAVFNGCPAPMTCQARWGFGARCLPVPLPDTSIFGSSPAAWHCGADPSADECTTSSDCDPVGLCVSGRCGGFARSWGAPGTAPAWVSPSTAAAGNACADNAGCAQPGAVQCNAGSCGDNHVPIEWTPEVHTAIAYAAAQGLAFVMSAGNYAQRLGLLSDDLYTPTVAPLAQRTLVGHDRYKWFHTCPFPGCQGPSGGWVVGATAGEGRAPAWFTNRGPRVDVSGQGERVATLGLDGDNPLHSEAAGGAGNTTNNYWSDFNGTSAAAPIIGALATSLQGIIKASTGSLASPATVLAALKGGVVPTLGVGDEAIAGKPLMKAAIAWLTTHPPAGGAGAPVLPAALAGLSPPSLSVTEMGATFQHKPGLKTDIAVAFTVKNTGDETSPPLGLRVTFGSKGSTAMPPAAPGAKVAASGGNRTLGWSCVRNHDPNDCCASTVGGPAAVAGCNPSDLTGRPVFLPSVDGKKASSGGGTVTRFFRFEISTPDYLTAGGANPEVCVMLDRQARNSAASRLNPGGAPPDIHRCATLGVPPEAVAVTMGYKLRPLSFSANPIAKLCGKELLLDPGNIFIADLAAVTRNRNLLLTAMPHSGTVAMYDFAACKEIDFDPANAMGSCGAPAGINRLDFTGQTPGIAAPCDDIKAKLGRNPYGLAVSRDQRFVAVVMRHLKKPCEPGKLALIDLRDPTAPQILQEDDGAGGKHNIEVPIGPNPKAVAISHEGTKDARIVVVHDTSASLCGKAPSASIVELADVLDKGSKAPVKTSYFVYKCPGAYCAPAKPVQIQIDEKNLGAFVTFEQQAGKVYVNTGSIGLVRLADGKAFVFQRESSQIKGWDRPQGLDLVNLGGGNVRVAFVAYSFYDKDKDWSGNQCKAGYTCAGLHWLDIDVPAGTRKDVNVGRLIPGVTFGRDILLSKDKAVALVVSNATWVARYLVNGWLGIALSQAYKLGGGKIIIRLPEADGFCPDELCNGVDDDCNGQTDEPWPALDEPCSVGVGACHKQGKQLCTADGKGLQCSAVPGAPQAESCNGIDDDCDGEVDEPWKHLLGSPCSAGTGQCKRHGKRVCAGAGTACDAVAAPGSAEVCNLLDDDCDGQTDEGLSCNPPPDPCAGVGCGGKGSCKTAGGKPWCLCQAGSLPVGLSCVQNLSCNVPPPKWGPCPSVCTGGCLGEMCIIACAGKDACKAATVACDEGRSCRVECIGQGACGAAQIKCGDGLLCELRCDGQGACGGAEMICGKGMCSATFGAGAGKLAKKECAGACACL